MLSILKNPECIFCNSNKHLILLSHMRSRSSVLSHILGSSPSIVGYRELHLPYRKYIDLLRVKIELKESTGESICNQFLYDKLLHDWCEINEKYLHQANFKFIILLREPESTIKSILHMSNKIGVKNFESADLACNYYVSRMNYLASYSHKIRGRYFLIESDDLIDDDAMVLSELSSWLNLDKPLSKEYKIFEKTGQIGAGDPLENIQKGTLVRTKPSDIQIPARYLERATKSYMDCLRKLKDN
jgi:hypothetical protein